MQVTVEAPSNLERRMTVTVPVEKFEQAFDKRIANLAKTVKVNGFRAGKIPLNYIKQRFGDSAKREALSDLIQTSLQDAIHQEKLTLVGIPNVQPKEIIPGQPLEFVATFEILPEINTVYFKLDSIEKEVATIADSDIDKVIEYLKNQHTTWKPVQRPAQEKDQVIIDFRGSIEGKVFEGGEAHDYPIIIGSKLMIPGFEEGLIGLATDDKKTLQITFPDNYFANQFSGKSAEYAIEVHKVSEPIVPQVNEAFIQKLGVKSGKVEDLRADIRKNLGRELEQVIKGKFKNKIFDHLLEQNPVEVPQSMVKAEATRLHDELHPHHAGKEHSHTAAEMESFNQTAKRNVILGLLIAGLIKQHKITLDKQRLQEYITQISAAYQNPAEIMKWYVSNKKASAEVEMLVLEDQILEILIKDVSVSEKTLTYSELLGKNK